MTLAAFIAAWVWPIFLVLIILKRGVRDPTLSRSISLILTCFFMLCVILMMAYGQSSMVAVFDGYFLGVFLGSYLIWLAFRELRTSVPDLKTKLAACITILVGGIFVMLPIKMLLQDLFQSPLVLKGRVQNVRVPYTGSSRGGVPGAHVAEIGGHTVKLTTPIYEEFKLLPVARVEVGRGSNYVYEFEHLAD